MSPAAKAAAATEERRRTIHKDWCARHPDHAAELRALRLVQRESDHRWRKGQGTAATHEQAQRSRRGALARLYETGAIDAEQLGWSQEIAEAAERVIADVAVRTVSYGSKIDHCGRSDSAFFEALGAVRREVAYTRWRAAIAHLAGGRAVAPILSMILEDVGVTIAARDAGMHVRRARRVLGEALDLWPEMLGSAMREVDEATLLAAQAGLF